MALAGSSSGSCPKNLTFLADISVKRGGGQNLCLLGKLLDGGKLLGIFGKKEVLIMKKTFIFAHMFVKGEGGKG